MIQTTGLSSLNLQGFRTIFESSPGAVPKVFLVGETHWSTYRKIIAGQLLNRVIVDRSLLVCESMKSFRVVSDDKLKDHILSDLYISNEKKEQIGWVTGWDTMDIYFDPENPDRHSAYFSVYKEGISLRINDLIIDLKILLMIKGGNFDGIPFQLQSVEEKLDWIHKKFCGFREDFEKKLNHFKQEHEENLAVWEARFRQFDLPFFELPDLLEMGEKIAKIELEKSHFTCNTAEKIELFAKELNEISANLILELQAIRVKSENFHKQISKERWNSFPQRTDSMSSTLLKIQDMDIEGIVVLIAGLDHLREKLSPEDKSDRSLDPLYKVLTGFRHPVVVLYHESADQF